MKETLGERIRQTRLAYGMSQAELARRIQISANAMNQIETGKTPDPGILHIMAIADVLGVSIDYLVGREPDEDGAYQPRHRRRVSATTQAGTGAS